MNLNVILEALVREFGRDILKERGRVLGLMADRHPDAKREMRLLKVAYEAGVVEDLRRDGGEHTQRRALLRLTEDFVIEHGAALFTMEALCAVLGHPTAGLTALAGSVPPPAVYRDNSFAAAAPALPSLETIHGWPAAKVQALQQQTAAALGRPVVFRDRLKCGCEGPEMVVIPAGRYTMGSPDHEPERYRSEGPQHSVTIAQPFALGQYAVTFDDYDRYCLACDKEKPADQGWGRDRRPVINVSWEDARAYCAWLSGETGQNYRLPSEAEWEYACRAGSVTPFWWGDTIGTGQANYNGGYVYNGGKPGEFRRHTLTVDAFEPNPFSLYQMHGNVREWCKDARHDNYQGAPEDGGPWLDNNPMVHRIYRGGSWFDEPMSLRAADRPGYTPSLRTGFVGFRVARDFL